MARITGAHHTSFTVADLGGSIEFFCDRLGLELVSRRQVRDDYFAAIVGLPGAAVEAALLRVPGTSHHVELFEEHVFQPGFLGEFAAGGLIQRFLHANETAGQGPFALKRYKGTLDEQHLEFTLVKTEDDTVHGQRRPGILVCVRHK